MASGCSGTIGGTNRGWRLLLGGGSIRRGTQTGRVLHCRSFWHDEPMTFTIRRPGPSDAATIADLHVATWRETYGHLLPDAYFSDEHIAGRHRMWESILTEPREDMAVRVAESAGSIIGFALVGAAQATGDDEPPRDRQLYAIYVAASHHGTGAGQSLLDDVLGEAPAMLWVAKENPRATAFYVRNGFRFDGVEMTDPQAPLITEARMVREMHEHRRHRPAA